jgi:hypothetical protein
MKPFTNKHSHEARERAALMNDMPIDNRGVGQMNTSALLDAGHGGKGHPHPFQDPGPDPKANPKAYELDEFEGRVVQGSIEGSVENKGKFNQIVRGTRNAKTGMPTTFEGNQPIGSRTRTTRQGGTETSSTRTTGPTVVQPYNTRFTKSVNPNTSYVTSTPTESTILTSTPPKSRQRRVSDKEIRNSNKRIDPRSGN